MREGGIVMYRVEVRTHQKARVLRMEIKKEEEFLSGMTGGEKLLQDLLKLLVLRSYLILKKIVPIKKP